MRFIKNKKKLKELKKIIIFFIKLFVFLYIIYYILYIIINNNIILINYYKLLYIIYYYNKKKKLIIFYMDKEGNKIVMGLDVSTTTIGITILIDDGSDYGKLVTMTHISPKIKSSEKKNMKSMEVLFVKKRLFVDFIKQFSQYEIDQVIIEEPLLLSNNINTVATLLRFNGMISDSIYEIFGVVPDYISSYEAREYSFPELLAVRKFDKKDKLYDRKKIVKSVQKGTFTLFGSYPWTIDKKSVIHEKVSKIFPEIQWQYTKKGCLSKENFDATDSYVACLGYINKERYGVFGEDSIKVENIVETDDKIEYDICYWGKTDHRITYFN